MGKGEREIGSEQEAGIIGSRTKREDQDTTHLGSIGKEYIAFFDSSRSKSLDLVFDSEGHRSKVDRQMRSCANQARKARKISPQEARETWTVL
jgi:hypothetical protein